MNKQDGCELMGLQGSRGACGRGRWGTAVVLLGLHALLHNVRGSVAVALNACFVCRTAWAIS